jgi:hypothetical protein
MPVKTSEYKGHPIFELHRWDNDSKPLRFGTKKARLILEHIDDIREFVEENSEE